MRILVFRTGQLGDTLVAIPALKRLREHLADATFDYLHDVHLGRTYLTGKEVIQGSGLMDHFIPYPVGYGRLGKIKALFAAAFLLLRIRFRAYDCLVNLVQPPRSAYQLKRDRIFFRLAGIKKQIIAAPAQSRGLANEDRPLKVIQHEADFLLGRLAEQGIGGESTGAPDPTLTSADEETQFARGWMKGRIPDGVQACVAVAVGSKMQSKVWPGEYFAVVLQNLWKRHGVWPVFFGGPSDIPASEAIARQIGAGSVAAGHFSIRGSLALLRECDFYLGNDTGTMHLAVAAGLKCVAIFSARDQPGRWYPYGEGHFVHRKAVDCEGCMLLECYEEQKKCLTRITPEEVYESCVNIIGDRISKIGDWIS